MDLDILRQLPILSDFSDSEIKDLFANAIEHQFSPGSFLCQEGEHHKQLYFLLRGEVQVLKKGEKGDTYVLANLQNGALLGELAWIMDVPCTASLRALKETSVLLLNGDTLTQQLQQRSPGACKLSTALLRLLAGRLMRMNEQFLQSQSKTNDIANKKGEIERLRERILQDWSF